MRKLPFVLTLVSILLGFTSCAEKVKINNELALIPAPQKITVGTDYFKLTRRAAIELNTSNPGLVSIARYFSDKIAPATGFEIPVEKHGNIEFKLIDDEALGAEGYHLLVKHGDILLTAHQPAGIFYGVQTLLQLLPSQVKGDKELKEMKWMIPCVDITDTPQFPWRGMMLDVSRHFFTKDEVKKFIDELAEYKMNVFHWHLTDDQGWRIDIKSLPRLTEVGAWRAPRVGQWWQRERQQPGEEATYGGFYTQEDIKEVLAYAAERYVRVIPEIDVPGHSLATLVAYPELACMKAPDAVNVGNKFYGEDENTLCVGKEETFVFMDKVLTEVAALFPDEYVHIGGDECYKGFWHKCPRCQARMKAENLKNEDELQSYFIHRMEAILKEKGKKLIGWDEILEGGLAPNATVMSWRGVEGGIEAAKQGHDAIMTPSSYLYFDYYQSTDTENEPLAIGGYNPLEKVYGYEPVPAELTDNEKKHIIGVQANLWAEYLPTFAQRQYMTMPRIAALAEIQWTEPAKKDYRNFLDRLVRLTSLYDRLGYNYGKQIFDISATFTPDTENGQIIVALSTLGGGDIHYTLDGSEPTAASSKYEAPLNIKENSDVKAVVIRPDGNNSRVFSEKITYGKATAKPIKLKEEPSKGYAFNGAAVLVDGLSGNDNYKTGRWLGFQGKDLDATIDLKEPMEISKVSFNTNVVKGDWIMGASGVTVLVSEDGATFKEVANKSIASLKADDKDGLYPQEITFAPVKARYVEVIIKSDKLPAWHGGAGNPAFLFVDEINID